MSRGFWLLAGCALASACSVLVDPDQGRLARTAADAAVADLGVASDLPVDALAPDRPPAPDAPVAADAPDAAGSRCAAPCDDGVECTVDSCDEAAGACAHRVDDSVCGVRQLCHPTMDCVRVDCTSEAECQDDTLCNGRERCEANRCVPGVAVRCDDDVDCTVDRCDPGTGECSHAVDSTRCDDGTFCNGAESCDPRRGCRPGAPPECDDRIGCTADRCDEAMRRCVSSPNPSACAAPGPCVTAVCDPTSGCRNTPIAGYCDSFCASGARCDTASGRCAGGGSPRDCSDDDPCTEDLCDPAARACRSTAIDADGDGFAAARVGGAACARGDDCNDADPAVHRGVDERCNGVDDDCDGAVDEDGVCIAPGEDCAHAIALDLTGTTASLTRAGTTAGRVNDFASGCGGAGPDLVFAVTIPGGVDVVAEATPVGGDGDPVVSVRDTCAGAELVCNGDATQRARDARVFLRSRSSASRVVFVVVDEAGSRGGPFMLRVSRAAAIAPANCGARPLFDVTAGGTVLGRTTTGQGTHFATCGGALLGEDVMLFTAAARTAVNLQLVSSNQVTYVRQRQCAGLQSQQLACFNGAQRVTLEAGSAWIIVDAARDAGEGQYVLRVQP